MADATWLAEYEETNVECGLAAAVVALEPKPRVWPISGLLGTEWNPNGYPESPYPTEKIPAHN